MDKKEDMTKKLNGQQSLGNNENKKTPSPSTNANVRKRNTITKRAAEAFPLLRRLTAPLTADKIKELVCLAWNDTGNAERMMMIFGRSVLYCPESPKGNRWHAWNGRRWMSICDERMYDFVSYTMRFSKEIYAYYTRKVMPEDANDLIKKYNQYCSMSENISKIKATVDRASGMAIRHMADLDKDPMHLNVGNGIICLTTGQLIPHAPTYYCTRICRADYVPGAYRGSIWERTLQTSVPDPDVRNYLQMYCGYMLTGMANEAKLLFILGDGGTGKTTFVNAIKAVMGNYADAFNPEILLSSNNDADGGKSASPGKAKLAGLRAAIASETDMGRRINEAQLKNLTGGDIITARYLYGQEFSFKQIAKFVLVSNYAPNLRDVTDGGIKRRLVIIRFDHKFINDRELNLENELQTDKERAAILDWLVQGTIMWVKAGGLPDLPASVKRTMAGYYEENDWLSDALCDLTVEAPQKAIKAKILIDGILAWLGHANGVSYTRQAIIQLLVKRGYAYIKMHGTRYFRGLADKRSCSQPPAVVEATAPSETTPSPAALNDDEEYEVPF